MTFGFGEAITVTRMGASTGEYTDLGDPVTADDTTLTITGVGVAPLTAEEAMEMWGPTNHGGYTLYLPYGSVLLHNDTVEVRGESGFQVDGPAGSVQWRSPHTGLEFGAVATVRRAS